MKKMTAETLFCVKYLKEHGVDSSNFGDVIKLLNVYEVPEFNLVKCEGRTYFTKLALELRNLWPPGEKDGKYPWRDSVTNLTERLKLLWKMRQLREYPIETCLSVARRYLAQYENDTRYMQTLKYFIMKQKGIVNTDSGKLTYVQESKFADMLEGKSDIDAVENEWDRILESTSVGEGDLV